MSKFGLAFMLVITSNYCMSADEVLDADFFEWLGQVVEVEELGVNINELIQQQELDTQDVESKEKTQ